ncbi:acetoin utilization protein AcuC [Allobranchiibius sp. GilTou38]|uniref:acetoin utilization protein AcuC n=1 Tax=Allobranchiibius sp. GilTou38 TaxID=2815210 RepID=UPI001AA1B8AE|nr:acetoin utilization protein AcuC [Allobranchiibius sp. GilTou38]MBO1766039.1 acetoin utilization protein AcuC [Allobranchiibius sp. GilTou38]
MTASTRIVWDERLTRYDFGDHHPMDPRRLALTAVLAREYGVFDAPGVQVTGPSDPTEDLIRTVHDAAYVEAVRVASADPELADTTYGLGTTDDPAFLGMHEASALIAAGTRDICDAVWSGEVSHGVNFAGGMHHAMPGNASGFCVYNDVAIGIESMLRAGAQRVAYVDLDVHHGDGVEKVFWDDPRVLTISIHEGPRTLFPGTGDPADIGGPGALGGAANIALPPGVGDAAWLRALHAVVPGLLRAFAPQVLVTQHGCDSHYLDPLAHLRLSVDAQRTAAESMHDLAHEVADGRWVALGGGGYEIVDVVPRTWTHLLAIAAHAPIPLDTAIPAAWHDYARMTCGRPGPPRMGDGVAEHDRVWWKSWATGADPNDRVDQCVLATREAVFPEHGLDVWFD